MVVNALAFFLGVLWVQTRPELGGLWIALCGLSVAAAACAFVPTGRARELLQKVARVLVIITVAIAWTGLRAQFKLDSQVLKDIERSNYRVTGTVVSIPQSGAGRVQFDFAPDSPSTQGLPRRLRLNWYEASATSGIVFPRAAERWQLEVRLRPPQGFANPGGFDYEGQLFREGIGAIGHIRASGHNRRLSAAQGLQPVLRLRAAIVERMMQVLEKSSARGVMIGLAVGVTDEIRPDQWQVFRATGITHLIAISGLHVTMIAVLGMGLVRAVWWLPWRPRLRSCRSDIAAVVGAIAAAAYALLAGFSVPTQRTLVMFLAALAALGLRRAQPPSNILSVALIAVLIFDPHAAMTPGFWLSFLAVAGIFWAMGPNSKQRRPWREFLSVQAIVTVILLPATLMLFGSISMGAALINLLAIPFFSFLLVPGILLSLALMTVASSAGAALLQFMAFCFDYFWPFLEGAANLPGAWMHLPLPGVILALTLCMTAIMLITPLPIALRALGAFALVPLFFPLQKHPEPGGLQLTVLDVGQGLSVFVRTRTHALLYDAGPSFRTGRSAGDLAVVPFLWSTGVNKLDMLVISHSDNDHAGGAAAVLDSVQVQSLRYGAAPTPAQSCRQGEAWDWDGVHFEFLHPRPGEYWNDNDGSCFLSISSPGGRILLTGDLQAKAENHLAALGHVPPADIVLIPHHGSHSSSTLPFVEAIHPRYAIVSAGYRNRWNFPDSKVVKRWCHSGAEVMGTAQWGAISVGIDPSEGIGSPQAYRLLHRRYWHATTPAAGVSLCTAE